MTWDDKPLEIARRQPRAILYRLAVRSKPVPRGQFCLIFWPDIPESEARRHLSNQLYNLKRALPNPDMIQSRGELLVLDPQQFWSDVMEFEHLTQSLETKKLQQAIDLYRGPFLDGFSLAKGDGFNQWMERERRDFERKYLRALSKLMGSYAQLGDHEAAITCALDYLEIDDLAEDVHRKLIDLYVAQGNRKAALRQYERCVTLLERELGVEPLPETREVYLAALDHNVNRVRQTFAPNTWTTLPSLESPLVGRDEAINHLKTAFSKANSGAGKVVLISGEAGVGKSRLLEDFIKEVASESMILIGGGYEGQGNVAYLPLVEALQPLLPKIDWTSLRADPLQLAQLLRLFPELERHVPNLPEPVSMDQEWVESPVYQGLAHLMICLARLHPPLILCLDDLHWTDETTRSWIGYFGRYLKETPLLLLGGYRMEEAEEVESLRADLAKLNVLEEIQLQNLTEEDLSNLIQRLSGQISGGEFFCHNLHRLTGGNPFFLLETLRILLEENPQAESGWRVGLDQLSESLERLRWSKSVIETVHQRLRRLRPTAIQLLQAGAVLGQHFELDLVRDVSGRSEREVLDALDELTARQVVIARKDNYSFKHELIRTVVVDNLSYGRRRLLHRRAGNALESREPGNIEALARHFAEAGEISRAANYCLQAGDHARRLFAYREAIEYYQKALAYQKENGALAEAAQTLLRLGLSHQIAFEHIRAQQAYAEGFALKRKIQSGPPDRISPAPHPLRIAASSPLMLEPSAVGAFPLYIKQLFSGLVRSGKEWSIQPEVAKSWDISADGRHYVFRLRDDVRWSDREPVTAYDFEFAWKRFLSVKTGDHSPSMLYGIRGARAFNLGESTDPDSVGVRAVDASTLTVDLEEPAGYFINLLTHTKMVPVPRHVIERHGNDWTRPDYLVTNGPFLLKDWEPDERISFIRNPSYFGDFRGNLTQIEIQLYDEWSPENQLEAYRADQIDVLLLEEETYHSRQQYLDEYHQIDAVTTVFLGFGSVEGSPFQDRRVRQALNLALDRNEFVRQTIPGFYLPAIGGFLPPGLPGHSPKIGLPYDPEKAKSLLRKAGYRSGKDFPRLDLLVPENRAKHAQVLQKVWNQNLGIHIGLNVMQWSDFMKKRQLAPLFVLGWGASFYPDPDYFLRLPLHDIAGWWRNPAYDQLIQKAAISRVQAERLQLYRQADSILMEDASIIPLTYQGQHYLVKPWVKTSHEGFSMIDTTLQGFSMTDMILEAH